MSITTDTMPQAKLELSLSHVSYSLKLLKGGYMGDYVGEIYRGY